MSLPVSFIFYAFFLCVGAFAGGAAITANLVNDNAAIAVLWLGTGWLIFGLSGLVWLRRYARHRVIGHLMFMALLANVALMPLLFALALPLFFLHGVFSLVGSSLAGFFLVTLIYQLHRGREHFNQCWEKNHEKTLSELYNPHSNLINIEPLVDRLGVKANLFLPGNSELVRAIVSIASVISMIIGLNLRKVFPVFSAFAWGIPALAFTTICVQMALLRILLAVKILELEKTSGSKIGPIGEEERQRTKPRKRKARSK